MTEPTFPGAAGIAALGRAGVTAAEAQLGLVALARVDARTIGAVPGHACHRCQAPATQQWPRHATPGEAENWHTAREQWIRAHNDGRPEAEYVSDRSDTVTLAVYGCDQHVVPEPHRVHDADCGGHGACRCGGPE